MLRTANPAFSDKVFLGRAGAAAPPAQRTMTVSGAVNRSAVLMGLLFLSAAFTWRLFAQSGPEAVVPWMIGGVVGGLVLALVTIFKQDWAAITAPLYALAEGLFLGALSGILDARFPGIAIQAVGLTFGVLFTLLVLYRAGVLKATPAFTRGVIAATGAVCLVYLVTIVMGFLGVGVPYIHGAGLIGIGFSLVVVVIAALNLVLDFDLIERGAAGGLPKHMEWYAAFALMVTLVWLYLELLRLLAKLRSR